jgi:hypothetical protein
MYLSHKAWFTRTAVRFEIGTSLSNKPGADCSNFSPAEIQIPRIFHEKLGKKVPRLLIFRVKYVRKFDRVL